MRSYAECVISNTLYLIRINLLPNLTIKYIVIYFSCIIIKINALKYLTYYRLYKHWKIWKTSQSFIWQLVTVLDCLLNCNWCYIFYLSKTQAIKVSRMHSVDKTCIKDYALYKRIFTGIYVFHTTLVLPERRNLALWMPHSGT